MENKKKELTPNPSERRRFEDVFFFSVLAYRDLEKAMRVLYKFDALSNSRYFVTVDEIEKIQNSQTLEVALKSALERIASALDTLNAN